MRDKPFGAALLDVAQQALTQDIAPALKGQQRYVVLMVANAIGIVAREIEQEVAVAKAWDRALARVEQGHEGSLEASASRLVQAIRDGEHDADPVLHSTLLETAGVAAGIYLETLAREAVERPLSRPLRRAGRSLYRFSSQPTICSRSLPCERLTNTPMCPPGTGASV